MELVITLVNGGQGVNIVGPLQNKLLCLGMLECAKEALLEWHKQQAQAASEVQPATADQLKAMGVKH